MSKIGIIGAMELEVAELKSKCETSQIIAKAGMEFYEGFLHGTDVVIVRCGVGKVNAALCVQILADHFHVTHIINTGVAGSLNAKLDIGDIVISKDAMYHDVDATIFGYALGEVPQLGILAFPADKNLASLAETSCKKINPNLHTLIGRIVSGDQFISKKEIKDKIINSFHGDCVEMEGTAIAHGAYLNHIPFVIIRAISDKADNSAEMDYPTFEAQAAQHSARLVEDMILSINDSLLYQ